MAVYGASEVLEFNPAGIQIRRVTPPSTAPRVTHIAIQPGTRQGFGRSGAAGYRKSPPAAG
jgi:hypothetical protein